MSVFDVTVEESVRRLKAGESRLSVFDNGDETLYRRVRSYLHPDRPSGDQSLFDAATKVWEHDSNPLAVPVQFEFRTRDTLVQVKNALSVEVCGSGARVVTPTRVGYTYAPPLASYACYWGKSSVWPFANDAMKTQCLTGPDAFLPEVTLNLAEDNTSLHRVRHVKDAVPLDKLVAHEGGSLPPEHVAWVVSGLFNIACYFDYAGIVHLGMIPEAVFVDPITHRVSLPGGWGHAISKSIVNTITFPVPRWVVDVLPRKYRGGRIVSRSMNCEQVRALGRWLLGDVSGTTLVRSSDTKIKPIIQFLLAPSKGRAVEQYREWKQVTETVFGSHRFVPMRQALLDDPTIVYTATKR